MPFIGVFAQDDTKQTKSISKEYNVGNTINLEVSNKYGQVIVNSWNEKKVKVEVVVTAYGKNSGSVYKTLNRVDFDFNQVNSYIILETVLDRKSGFLKELLNDIGDYSKTLLSKNKLQIDYELFVPKYAVIKIDNKFGDVFLGDMENNCTIILSNGNLKAKDITNYINAEISFGNAYFNFIKKADMDLKVSDIEIERVEDLNINSSSSEIVIHDAQNLRINSRNDKLKINKVENIHGKSNFSKIEISKLLYITDLDMSYGFLAVSEINDHFSKIHLDGKSTDFNLSFNQSAYFNASLIARQDKLIIPNKIADINVDHLDNDDNVVSVNGFIGKKNATPGSVNIDAQKGDLKVFFIKSGN